jgi:hypothetical protein
MVREKESLRIERMHHVRQPLLVSALEGEMITVTSRSFPNNFV